MERIQYITGNNCISIFFASFAGVIYNICDAVIETIQLFKVKISSVNIIFMKPITFLLYSFFISVSCFSQTGTLDITFGDGGKVYTDVLGQCYAAALQPDGKILVGGGSAYYDYTLIRYLPDGSLDGSFGNNGIAAVDVSTLGSTLITGIVALADKSIITCGGGVGNLLAIKFKPGGKPDSAFRENGNASIDFG